MADYGIDDVDFLDLDDLAPDGSAAMEKAPGPTAAETRKRSFEAAFPPEKPAMTAGGIRMPSREEMDQEASQRMPDLFAKRPKPSSPPPARTIIPANQPAMRAREEHAAAIPQVTTSTTTSDPLIARTRLMNFRASSADLQANPRSPNGRGRPATPTHPAPPPPPSDGGAPGVQAQTPRRRLPGPAGILSLMPEGQSFDDLSKKWENDKAGAKGPPMVEKSAQLDQALFKEDFDKHAWKAMLTALKLPPYEARGRGFSVASPALQASVAGVLSQDDCGKVPCLILHVTKLSFTDSDASATFKDPTGEIRGTIQDRVLEEYQGELLAGAVVLLRQVSVYTPRPRVHHLMVTMENVVYVFPCEPNHVKYSMVPDNLMAQLTAPPPPGQEPPPLVLPAVLRPQRAAPGGAALFNTVRAVPSPNPERSSVRGGGDNWRGGRGGWRGGRGRGDEDDEGGRGGGYRGRGGYSGGAHNDSAGPGGYDSPGGYNRGRGGNYDRGRGSYDRGGRGGYSSPGGYGARGRGGYDPESGDYTGAGRGGGGGYNRGGYNKEGGGYGGNRGGYGGRGGADARGGSGGKEQQRFGAPPPPRADQSSSYVRPPSLGQQPQPPSPAPMHTNGARSSFPPQAPTHVNKPPVPASPHQMNNAHVNSLLEGLDDSLFDM